MLISTHQIQSIIGKFSINVAFTHLIHLNINSLLSEIDELPCYSRKKSRATVTGITESKLDETLLDGELNIGGYELVRSDRK